MKKQKIPFFPYPKAFIHDKESYINIFTEVCSRGAFILQDELKEFEKKLCDLTGSKFALGVANATDGLQIALMAGGVKLGDEVIFSSHTMIATASSIKFAGGVPVPVESGSDHLICPDSIRESITEKTVAIVPTQLNGRTSNMDDIATIAEEYGLDIYEDAAQALGSKYKDQYAGTFGVGSCISFYPAKILGCFGDGGAVLCQDQKVYNKLKLLRDHGRDETNEVVLWGMNSRLDNIQAAFLSHKLESYEAVIERRRHIASLYDNLLREVNQLILPPPPEEKDHFDIYQNYEIEAEDRDGLKDYLSKSGVGTLVQWSGIPVHQFIKLGFNQKLPLTDELFKRLLMIPIHPFLKDEEVEYIANSIKGFYK